MISLQIDASGGIQMLQDDALDLRQFGKVEISRASHVEFDNGVQAWYVQSAKTGEMLHYAQTRAEALAWEKAYYSPSGPGWAELTQEVK